MKTCYACGKPRKVELCRLVRCIDDQTVFVGPECFRRIKRAGALGYQPPLGGPRLFMLDKAPALSRPMSSPAEKTDGSQS